jgi:hypothetical protein
VPTPTFISAVAIQLGTSASPGAQSITVPSDAEGVLVFTRNNNNANVVSLTSSFAGTFTRYNNSSGEGTSVSVAAVTSTGSQTITPSWTGTVGEGPLFVVAFVKDVDTSSVGAWVRDTFTEFDNASLVGAVDSTADDLVLVFDSQYGFGDPPAAASGWTSRLAVGPGFENNAELGRLSTANSPGSSTTSYTSQGNDFDCLAMISLIGASGGGGGVEGTASITESADTASSTAGVAVAAQATITDGANTVTASAAVALAATGSVTEGADTASGSASVPVVGQASATEADDTNTGAGAVAVAGQGSVTEAADTVSASGTITSGVTGTASITEAADTAAGTGTIAVAAQGAATETADTATGTATTAIAGQGSITEGADTVSGTGLVPVSAVGVVNESPDSVTSESEPEPEPENDGRGFVITDTAPRLWWQRKPKALGEQEAEERIERVVRVVERIARTQVQAVQAAPAKERKAEVRDAIAPLVEQMPGFDWMAVYRAILIELERKRQDEAQRVAMQEIARIQAIEQDDEDVLLLLMSV